MAVAASFLSESPRFEKSRRNASYIASDSSHLPSFFRHTAALNVAFFVG